MTEGQKKKINKEYGPRKDVITVKEREHAILGSVPAVHRKSLEKIIHDAFPEKLPKGAAANR